MRPPSRSALWFALALAACTGAAPTPAPQSTPRAFDLLLRGGTVVDGTGSPAYRADVGIVGGHVAAIGDLATATATTTLDVAGLIVAPGFLNIHAHPDRRAMPTAENMLRQGVTSEFGNSDGGGPLELRRTLAAADSASLAINVGLYAPFGTAWERVVGQGDRRPTPAEIDSMRALLRGALAEGAWGVSAGLDYKPSYFATTDEVVSVVEVARPWRTNFPNHDRLTPENGYSSLAAMHETMVIGERAGLVPVVTHMKLQGHEQGRAAEALRMIDSVTRAGTYVAADLYPYLAGVTGLSAFTVPGWAQDGGRPAMLARFRDTTARARIAREMEAAIRARFGTADNIYLPDRKMTVAQLVPALGVATVPDAVMALLEERDRVIIASFGRESDLAELLRHRSVVVSCDCGAGTRMPHPRAVGTFPRVLGRYVREQRLMSWEEAVRRMSGLPASVIGMVDRGLLAVGMAADVVVFDSTTVVDHATYENEAAAPEGVRHVVVNGRLALRDGAPTGVAAGRPLLRAGNMVSRPPGFDAARAASVRASGVMIDLRQDTGARTASGAVRIARDDLALEATTLGVLQVAPGWATITGRAAVGGEALPFVLMIDERDPLSDGAPLVTVTLPGRAPVRIVLPVGSVRAFLR